MIKGKSTIQLFDAKTQKEVERVVNDNMLTNAISNILNVPLDYTYNIGNKSIYDLILPLQTVGLGGIEIWDNTIPEDASIVYPPANVHEVGHAGGEYSGTSKYRGSYNTNESGAIENGYRHVWDFRTDQANGDIKCLSLTSRAGGNVGLHGDDSTDSTAYGISRIRYTSESVYEKYLGCISKNLYVYMDTHNTDNYVYLRYVKLFDSSKIMLNQKTSIYGDIVDVKKIPIAKNSSYCTAQIITGSPTINLLYTPSNYGTSVYYAKINIATGELISENNVTLSIPSDFENRICYFNGSDDSGVYVFLKKNSGGSYPYSLYKFGIDGSYIGAVCSTSWSSYYTGLVHNIGGRWYVGTIGLTDKSDRLWVKNTYTDIYQCYNYNNAVCPVYLSPSTNDTRYGSTGIGLYNIYLATINNLAVPVTKTSALTMKITYDLIQT